MNPEEFEAITKRLHEWNRLTSRMNYLNQLIGMCKTARENPAKPEYILQINRSGWTASCFEISFNDWPNVIESHLLAEYKTLSEERDAI